MRTKIRMKMPNKGKGSNSVKRLSSLIILLFAALSLCFGRSAILVAAGEPSPEALRNTIRNYVSREESAKGTFSVFDTKIGVIRALKLERVHERVGKTGNYYYSCADLKDTKTGDLLDLDFDVTDTNGTLKVVDVRIHKDNGKPRYTYDENDNMVPVK